MSQIKEKAFFGLIWRGSYQAFQQLASLLVKIILIRLLLPADFGLLAMAMIVFTSLDIINRFAGGQPFIRDNDSDPYKAKNTLFYLNLLFLGLTAICAFISAPLVAQFFSKKISDPNSITTLVWLIRLFACQLLFAILSAVPIATLTKSLRFKQLYLGNIVGAAVYLVLTPFLAKLGFGVWSVAIGHLVEQIFITAFYFCYAPFLPSFVFDKTIAKKYIVFNSNIFVSSLILIAITNGDDTVIGRLYGPSVLGFYNVGQQLAMLATVVISANLRAVIFPIFSKLQNEKQRLREVFLKTFRLVILFSVPMVFGSVVLINEITTYFFGNKWLPIIPIFYILSLSALLTSLISVAHPLFNSLDMPHLVRKSQSIGLLIFVILIYPLTKFWGYLGVCWLVVIVSSVDLIYLAPKLARFLGSFYRSAFSILSRIFLSGFLMATVVYLTKQFLPLTLLSLIFLVCLGIATYFLTMALSDKSLIADFRDAFMLVKEKLSLSST